MKFDEWFKKEFPDGIFLGGDPICRDDEKSLKNTLKSAFDAGYQKCIEDLF